MSVPATSVSLQGEGARCGLDRLLLSEQRFYGGGTTDDRMHANGSEGMRRGCFVPVVKDGAVIR